MKKLIFALAIGVVLTSCGGDKKKEAEAAQQQEKAVVDQYSVIIDGIYEKNDSICVYYQQGNNYLYDKPVKLKIQGSEVAQRLTLLIPEGQAVENLAVCLSQNKEQDHIKITNISVKNGQETILDGREYNFGKYFSEDESFKWDAKLLRYILNHNNKYPPSVVGNEKLHSLLMK